MKHMRTANAAMAGLLISLLQIGTVYAHDVDDVLLASVGEFEIGNGDSKMIAHHKKDAIVRICVRNTRHSVPLKVMYDGKEQNVAAGDCADFEALSIRVAPGGKLDKDMVIVGRYQHIHS